MHSAEKHTDNTTLHFLKACQNVYCVIKQRINQTNVMLDGVDVIMGP